MHWLDWILFVGFLAYIVWDGIRKSGSQHGSEDYFMAGRSVPWWAAGLSIMATQASAITMIGTTGQGWSDGLRFVQFYFALPIAMILIAIWVVPVYHRLRVHTPYEYLGHRFDEKTRVLSALLFLVLRCASVGFVIYTPSLVLSRVFHLPISLTILAMGGVAVVYTSLGGLSAVISTDVKQMTVMTLGLIVAVFVAGREVSGLVGWEGAYHIAESAGRLHAVDWSWNPTEKYTVWSSLIGGLFLFLSYFGTDQSQAQRLLASRSVRDARGALLLNAVFKVPFQFLVLSLGVLLFVFYSVQGAPIGFEPSARDPNSVPAQAKTEYAQIEQEYASVQERLATRAHRLADTGTASAGDVDALQAEFLETLKESESLREEARRLRGGPKDTNYVFLDFILTQLPMGIVGLLLAAIFAAALSSIDSEINSMATVAVVDLFARNRIRRATERGESILEGRDLLTSSRVATVLIGAFATAFALYVDVVGSLVEVVNKFGSYIYGSLLGAFLLAFLVKRANGTGAFVGILVGMVVVVAAAQTGLAFLYLNTLGTVVVLLVGTVVSLAAPNRV
ncbi:MAG: sodium:solute symporter [Candidatus Eisenbacteria bacterium]|uniref:Sodium:solute symporter n=1 Tax=Eiseniibacteriota bacterium TaxID=2212470 RepID=A0A956N9S1_UNCEI|nr:sodium:solute symporter [Candidatus Eisenbacteria bacterium]